MQTTIEGWIDPDVSVISGERRVATRYPLQLEVEYRTLPVLGTPVSGSGRTRDLSSKSISLEIDEGVRTGTPVEVAVQWPVALNGCVPLKLMVRGRVVRTEPGMAVLRIEQRWFQTQRKASAAGMARIG